VINQRLVPSWESFVSASSRRSAANYATAGGEYGRVLTISSVPWLNSRIAVHAHAKGLPRTLQRKTHMIPFAQVSSDAKITPEMHAVETQ
jgi:hypothetical protein